MVCKELKLSKVSRILSVKPNEGCTCALHLLIICFPNWLVSSSGFNLLPREGPVSVLDQNVFVMLTKNLDGVLGFIEEHAARNRGPSPLKAITSRGLISWIIRSAHLIRSDRSYVIGHH
jgi:hypothetical protein